MTRNTTNASQLVNNTAPRMSTNRTNAVQQTVAHRGVVSAGMTVIAEVSATLATPVINAAIKGRKSQSALVFDEPSDPVLGSWSG